MELMEQEAASGVMARVGEWPSLSDAYEHALVVLAMNLACEVREEGGNFSLHAEPEHTDAIREEFALYAGERFGTADAPELPESPVHPWGISWLLAWAATLVLVFSWQSRDAALTDRFANSSEGLVERLEWWRPFTALFLHADVGHLLGNIMIGGIFCVIAARSLGAALAWPLILAAGALANAVNAWGRHPEHFASIGASTATFAALGVLVGNACGEAWKAHSVQRTRAIFIPIIAGFILLGWYGSGGENTDVSGHFWGWLAGAALGCLATLFPKRPPVRE